MSSLSLSRNPAALRKTYDTRVSPVLVQQDGLRQMVWRESSIDRARRYRGEGVNGRTLDSRIVVSAERGVART